MIAEYVSTQHEDSMYSRDKERETVTEKEGQIDRETVWRQYVQ